MASGEDNSDAAAAARFVAREHAGSQPGGQAAGGGVPGDADDGQLTWYADSAYGTGELRAAIGQAGDEAVIKPKPLKRAVEGGFTVDDFTVDHQAGTATCPAGTTRRITPAGAVNFGAACKDCPLRSRCTTAAAGKILHVGEHDQRLRQARRDWAGPDLRRDYRATRPSVERTVAHVALVRGRRLKLRYRGTSKNHAWLKRRTAAVNLRTLLRHGLARRNGTWTLTAPPA
jgi:hypothetical protein